MSLVPEKLLIPTVALIAVLLGFISYVEVLSSQHIEEERGSLVQNELDALTANIQKTLLADTQLVRGVASSLLANPQLDRDRFKKISDYLAYDKNQIVSLYVVANNQAIFRFSADESVSDSTLNTFNIDRIQNLNDQPRTLGEVSIAGPFKSEEGRGVLILSTPFFSVSPEDPDLLSGGVHLVIDQQQFYRASGLYSESLQIDVALRYQKTGSDTGILVFGSESIFEKAADTAVVDLPLVRWQIAAIPKEGVESHSHFMWAARLAYTIAAMLLIGAFVVILKARSTASKVNQEAEAVEQKISDTLKQVRDRENLLRTVINEMPDALVLKDHEGNFLLGNAAVAKLYGTTPEDMIGKHDGDFGVPKEMADFFRQNVQDIMAKGETEIVYEDSKDIVSGQVRHFKSIKKPFKGDDGDDQILVIAHDITDLVDAQHLLSESEKRLNTVLDNVDAYIYLKDLNGCYLFANRAVRVLWEVSSEQLVGCRDERFFDAETVKNIVANDRLVLDEGQTVHAVETNTVPTTGVTRTYKSTKLPLRNERGEIYALCGISVDITDLKKSEQALRESEQRFKMAGQAAYDLIYEWDVKTDSLRWFGDVDSMLGFQKGEISHDINAWLSLIHRDDTAQLSDAVERHRESTQPIQYEYRIADSKGNYRYWSDRALPMINEEGRPYKWVGVCTDITLQKDQQQKLEHSAYYDQLTGLPNRTLLTDRLKQAMSQSRRRKQQLAVVYIDLDGFKEINDTYGHEIGDKLLIAIGTRIQSHLREGDTISRLGGDEFVAVFGDLENSYAALPLLERLLQATSQPIMHGDLILQVSSSIGVTYYPQADEIAPDQLLRQADQAMYQAKLNGKNRYFFFDTENDRSLRGQLQSEEHIEQALRNHEFELYYQPKVNMRTGEVVGLEALLRWNHPEKGMLLPGEFLSGMENHLLTVKIGNWVIRSALSQIQLWDEQGHTLPVSINVTGSQLQDDFVEKLSASLKEYPNVDPSWLQLEVLESSALQDIGLISEVMQECEKIGVTFALDDFGTGYSSLTYLKYLPAAVLKIDRSFVRDMLDDPDDMAILEGVMGMSSAFRRHVVAEGVERIEQGVFLLRLGCELAQGFAIAKPMSADKVLDWISTWSPPKQWQCQERIRREDLAVLFAEVEHRAWVTAVDNYIKNPDLLLPPLGSHQCRFGQWWDEKGQYRYPENYCTLITDLHERVHFCGREIKKAIDREDIQQVSYYQTELHRVSSELVAELDRILNNLYGSQI